MGVYPDGPSPRRQREAHQSSTAPVHPRQGEGVAEAVERLEAALERQTDNMAFVLNRVDLHPWHERFSAELAEDRTALSTYRQTKEDTA